MTYTPPPAPQVACPHCGVANVYGAAFCESCGKALPPPVQAGPRVLYGNDTAATSAGVHVQTEELKTQAKKAAQALALVAGLTTLGAIVSAVVVFSLASRSGMQLPIGPADVVISFVVAAIFWGLFFWARKNPLPAAIVGLVLYVTLTVVQIASVAIFMREIREQQALEAAEQGEEAPQPSSTSPTSAIPGGMCGIWIRVLIVVMLVQGIAAGVKHRKLLKQQRGQAGAWPQGGYSGAPPGPPPMMPPPG